VGGSLIEQKMPKKQVQKGVDEELNNLEELDEMKDSKQPSE